MAERVAETTWLEGIKEIGKQDSPLGPVLLITLINDHRYAIPLTNPQVRSAISRIASPITIPADVRMNGSGA